MAEYEQHGVPFKFAERKSVWPGRKSKHDEEMITRDHDKPPVLRPGANEGEDKGGVNNEDTNRSGQYSDVGNARNDR